MSCLLASTCLIEIREELKPCLHGGRFFTSEDVGNLIRRLNTAISLAEEIEEEKASLERRERLFTGHSRPALVGPNVVAFPGSPTTPGGRA
ncbi:hypothetical protein AB4Z13_14490 [Rhizobium sp. YAF28]|uniref:hypothetical protein n=1 Tax=Rhizobium sp. YAF28 TaxID=3233081 RepID=UPI003F9CBE94